MEYWFNQRGRELDLGEWKTCKWGQGEPSAEHEAAFMYKLSSNGERGVFGSGVSNVTIWEKWHAYICEISMGKFFLLLRVFVVSVNIILSKLEGTGGA